MLHYGGQFIVVTDLVAYIDAGTGSYLLAAIAGGTAGVWFWIRGKIARLRKPRNVSATPSEDD